MKKSPAKKNRRGQPHRGFRPHPRRRRPRPPRSDGNSLHRQRDPNAPTPPQCPPAPTSNSLQQAVTNTAISAIGGAASDSNYQVGGLANTATVKALVITTSRRSERRRSVPPMAIPQSPMSLGLSRRCIRLANGDPTTTNFTKLTQYPFNPKTGLYDGSVFTYPATSGTPAGTFNVINDQTTSSIDSNTSVYEDYNKPWKTC